MAALLFRRRLQCSSSIGVVSLVNFVQPTGSGEKRVAEHQGKSGTSLEALLQDPSVFKVLRKGRVLGRYKQILAVPRAELGLHKFFYF